MFSTIEAHVAAMGIAGEMSRASRRAHSNSAIRNRNTRPTVTTSHREGVPQKEARDQCMSSRMSRSSRFNAIKTICCRLNESKSMTGEVETESSSTDTRTPSANSFAKCNLSPLETCAYDKDH